ncbi:hypothetical protein [Haloarcula nitratireducens]|uniref:Uncharacterized protein n=1 Tax=Haloarcula nitratireducens TaxID=2487749 RepID=A0AAW4PBS4_9EURY|nr:hypothetical protein [Halomicroarcula nitratireducens]MBX0295173.1 hypothetical protein [Halomicroarcula nitratireducens]
MGLNTVQDLPPAVLASFGIAVVLAGLAVYNYATGVYGGAIVSSIGTVIAALFGVLAD